MYEWIMSTEKLQEAQFVSRDKNKSSLSRQATIFFVLLPCRVF